MEFIILGLLMLKAHTLYDIRKNMKNSISLFYSDSPGSIQAALRKLMEKRWIAAEERLESGKHKKVYSILPPGRDAFLQWLRAPVPPDKAKDLMLPRLFFLGLLPPEERTSVIRHHLQTLQETHRSLAAMESQLLRDVDVPATLQDIYDYQMLSLRFGIDQYAFSADWYERLLARLAEGELRND